MGLINLDFAADLAEGLGLHRQPDAMEHEPRGLLGDSKRSRHFVGADPVLGVGDEPHARKPLFERDRRVLEDGPDLGGKLLLARAALPDPAGAQERGPFRTALRADRAAGPLDGDHEGQGSIRVREVDHGFLEGFGDGVLGAHWPGI
jgi:hypothetical protein